jgi:hypothetical protein
MDIFARTCFCSPGPGPSRQVLSGACTPGGVLDILARTYFCSLGPGPNRQVPVRSLHTWTGPGHFHADLFLPEPTGPVTEGAFGRSLHAWWSPGHFSADLFLFTRAGPEPTGPVRSLHTWTGPGHFRADLFLFARARPEPTGPVTEGAFGRNLHAWWSPGHFSADLLLFTWSRVQARPNYMRLSILEGAKHFSADLFLFTARARTDRSCHRRCFRQELAHLGGVLDILARTCFCSPGPWFRHVQTI